MVSMTREIVRNKADSLHSKAIKRIPDVVVGLFILKTVLTANKYINSTKLLRHKIVTPTVNSDLFGMEMDRGSV